ncbi:MAG: hypothetical protein ACK5FE_10050, partial [Cyanobacteriota bacterium]
SCRAWLALEQAGLDSQARWLGPQGAAAWNALQLRVGAWHAALAAVPRLPAGAPPAAPLAELLCGDLFSPALLGLALLPDWLEPLLGAERVILPIGARLRAPGPGRGLRDLPLLLLAALLRQRGVAVELPAVLGRFDPPEPAAAGVRLEAAGAAVEGPCLWLAIGKLRHPEIPLLAFEATGLAVRLVETEAAAPLPELFADAPRLRCLATDPVLQADPAAAPATDWLEALAGWSLLQGLARDLAAQRLELDHSLAAAWRQDRPRLLLVPEENSRGCERLVMQARHQGVPHGALHHTAELLPLHSPGRWQRHLEEQDPLLVPLRGGGSAGGDRAVLSADPVRAHLLEGLELEASLPLPAAPAVGWLHYPLQQQSVLPRADPLAYWQALGGVEQALRDRGVPLLLARRRPRRRLNRSSRSTRSSNGRWASSPLPRKRCCRSSVATPWIASQSAREVVVSNRPRSHSACTAASCRSPEGSCSANQAGKASGVQTGRGVSGSSNSEGRASRAGRTTTPARPRAIASRWPVPRWPGATTTQLSASRAARGRSPGAATGSRPWARASARPAGSRGGLRASSSGTPRSLSACSTPPRACQ